MRVWLQSQSMQMVASRPMLPRTSLMWGKWISIYRLVARQRTVTSASKKHWADNPSSQTLSAWVTFEKKKINGMPFLTGYQDVSLHRCKTSDKNGMDVVDVETAFHRYNIQPKSNWWQKHLNWEHWMRHGHLFDLCTYFVCERMRTASTVHPHTTSKWIMWCNVCGRYDACRKSTIIYYKFFCVRCFCFSSLSGGHWLVIAWSDTYMNCVREVNTEHSMMARHIFENWNVNKTCTLSSAFIVGIVRWEYAGIPYKVLCSYRITVTQGFPESFFSSVVMVAVRTNMTTLFWI